jgi:NADPH2:quinone reductase
MPNSTSSLQLRSTILGSGTLEVRLEVHAIPSPAPDEVVIAVEATPINPSDIGLLFGPADMQTAVSDAAQKCLRAQVSPRGVAGVQGRVDQPMPVGNEGAGRVIAAGSDARAQALMGRTVAVIAGGMYAQHRVVKAADCSEVPEGVSAAQAASCFVNPLTALGFIETLKREGHRALVHTAAASNLGQMLNRLCKADGIELVNIVRRPEQVTLLKQLGATHVCDSSSPTFMSDLTAAIDATGATLAFDATGGGTLANQILTAMEAALSRTLTTYSRYGSPVKKQVYLYGGLDVRPTELTRSYGMSWAVGGWLVFQYLSMLGEDANRALRARVMAEITTTFASNYTTEISLSDMIDLRHVAIYNQRATNAKVLVNPSLG